MYIYIVIHRQTVSFLHVGRLNLVSKPAKIYVRLSIRPLGQQAYHVGEGIIRYQVAAAAFVYFLSQFL